MLSRTFLTQCLPFAASLSLVSACGTTGKTSPVFPPAADLKAPAKPQLRPEDLTSEAALDKHDIDLEAWGDGMHKQIGRLCRWSVENGAKLPFTCPKPDS